ncbi:MAG: hypothetical protein VYE77_03805 [Planctomycetota bacterium]|nr:hypothetical protein [Planctomycetota bacterium]
MANLKTAPDHHDADLVLRLYDMRREAVMRQSRDVIVKFLPRSAEDVMALTQPDHPQNVAWRQVTSYFEMAFSFARHGVANPDFLAENNGEGLLLFAKIQPYLADVRREFPLAFKNAEWLTENSESARERVAMFQRRVAAMLEA